MNSRSDIDRVLQTWMADGPATIPDRVVDVVAARIGVQRQRRTWPFQRRTTVTPIKLIAGLAAALIVAVLGYNLLPKSSSNVGGTTPPGTASPPPPTVAPTPAPTVTSPSPTSAFPTTGILAPGTHSTQRFEPAITFSVSETWIVDGDSAGGPGEIAFFSVFPDTPANRAEWARSGGPAHSILIADLPRPYYACESWEDNRGATAAEMLAKVMANEALITEGVVDVEIGGLTGKQFDVRVNPAWTETCPGDPPGSDLSDMRTRSILLDVRGDGVLVLFTGTPKAADFEAHLALAMPVIESFEFDLDQ